MVLFLFLQSTRRKASKLDPDLGMGLWRAIAYVAGITCGTTGIRPCNFTMDKVVFAGDCVSIMHRAAWKRSLKNYGLLAFLHSIFPTDLVEVLIPWGGTSSV
jgi:hypothetical protein